jgi:LmbE family N-acetylglucosaminyl deacetylase
MKAPTLVRQPALVLSLAFAIVAPLRAQRPPAQLDGAAILHRMQKLGVVGSVLYVGAHPDDENTRLITWLSNGKKVRTAYLSLTRGDGGQNLIGPELGDALGILRTQELLEARRIDGGEQFFTRAVDFGYSKSADETFAKWGRQEVLGDVVRVIRTFRPDVIITRFATDGSGGHGHHTASALLAQEAFDLAADPKAFPEQLARGLEAWQVKRLFFNASTWWNPKLADEAAKDPARWVSVDVGGFDPLLGASYTEIAGRSRSQHKSQGFGAAETRGEQVEYLRLEKGAELATPDLFDGVELAWARFPGAEPVDGLVRDLVASYDPSAPEKCVPDLCVLVEGLDALSASKKTATDWAGFQADAARELVLQALGAVVQVTSKMPSVAPGESLPVTFSVLQRRPGPALVVSGFHCPNLGDSSLKEMVAPNRPWTKEAVYPVAGTQAFDQPYWLAMPHESAFFHPIEPMSKSAAVFTCRLRLPRNQEIAFDRQLMQTWVDRVAGERTRAVAITPIASIEIPDPVAIVCGEHAIVSAELVGLRDDLDGVLYASAPDGWSIESTPDPVKDMRRGERRTMQVRLRRTREARTGPLHLDFAGSVGKTDRTMHVIDYPHILPQTWYTPADVQLVPLDVAVSVKTVGYIDGAGDDVRAALRRLGVAVERIDPASASPADLEKCDAIVTGIRAYNTVQALSRFQPTLLAYVEGGGTLLVQYNTAGGDLVVDPKKLGPYPFVLTRDRVTVEEAPATFLDPTHPLLNAPNKLGAADFEGWVQERGLYFAGELDPKYTALIAWNDPGEKPLNGGLITCEFGKGRFTYTGISLFRQLPAGVPGAYRLLANLLARRNQRE